MKVKVLSLTEYIDQRALLFGVVTWLFSFGYQLAFYAYYQFFGSSLLTTHRNVFSYYSGMIGDGVILPILNVVLFLLLKEIGAKVTTRKFIFFLSLGLIVTIFIHLGQATLALTNWAMPAPFHWSGIGRFHFFFMWWEFAFLFFSLGEIIKNITSIAGDRKSATLFGLSWLGTGMFLVSFVIDYLKILRI